MNLEWLKWVLDEEVENGTIEGQDEYRYLLTGAHTQT